MAGVIRGLAKEVGVHHSPHHGVAAGHDIGHRMEAVEHGRVFVAELVHQSLLARITMNRGDPIDLFVLQNVDQADVGDLFDHERGELFEPAREIERVREDLARP